MHGNAVRRACCAAALACALACVLFAAGCASRGRAPVSERPTLSGEGGTRTTAQPAATPGATEKERADTYTVRRGDTLLVIALDHGHDYRDLAAWNNIDNPDRISVGQVLRLTPPPGTTQVMAVAPPQSIDARPLTSGARGAAPAGADSNAGTGNLKTGPKTGKETYSDQAAASPQAGARKSETQIAKIDAKPDGRPADEEEKLDWGWPVHGKMLTGFSETGSKGVDIAGKLGDPVIASASGKVVYSGTGLRGYGKLIIIKHSPTFLSAYAHNNQILVKEGQPVVKGQKIAEVGNTDTDQPKLHFEIRRLGKPVAPLKYLPAAQG